MKKQQKIIELRRAEKLKVAKIETKIAVARSEAASEHVRLLWERAVELEGLEAGSTERYDVQAEYSAKLAGVKEKLAARVAQLKAEITQIKAESEDYPEPEKEQPLQTVYCDGSEHSARIVARRLINKMPRVKCDGALFVHIICDADGDYFVSVSEQNANPADHISTIFSKDGHCEKSEAQFVERAREMFKTEEDEASEKAAEPLSRALDTVFSSNPVEQVDNLISDTVKDGKEADNE